MSLSNDKTLSHDEPRGLHWGWVVVASGFYCVTMEGGVGDIMVMIVMLTVILLSAGNSHRDPHGKPQTGFSAREHSHHFTSWRGSGILLLLASTFAKLPCKLLLQLFLMHFVGPIASMLMTQYGGHKVCMSGGAMAAVGLLAASYVNNIPLLILFYSVFTGLGFGLMYIPSIVSCVPYFTKNRLHPPPTMRNV